jgi:hypothetical protein
MGTVVAAAMDCTKVGGVIGAAVPLLDEVVSGVGPWLAAEVTDAPVADDHRSGEPAPGPSAVGTVERIAAHSLRPLPAGRAVDGRLPGQGGGPEMTAPARHVGLRALVFTS